jgi:ribosome-binding factor A
MSNQFKRTDRIAELMQRTLAQIIQQDVKIPGSPNFITLSAVKVSRDLGHANVYFTVFNQDPAEATVALNTAAGYLRSALAKIMTLRTVPQLHFIYDDSIEYGRRLSKLIDKVNDSEPDSEPDTEQD